MNTKLKEQQTDSVETYYTTNSDSIDFELWASAVKAQMTAVLEKRNTRIQRKRSN